MTIRKFFAGLLIAAACLPAIAAEKVISKFKDVTLDATPHTAFYVFTKNAKKYRNKEVVLKLKVRRSEGSAPLGATFRCSTNPGNQLRATRSFKIDYGKTGETVPVELRFTVPDLDNIHHFNVQFGFRKMGKEKTVWHLTDVRYCEPDPAAAKAENKPKLPEGFAAQMASATAKQPLVLVKGGKILFSIVIPDKANAIEKYAAAELQTHFKEAAGSAPAIVPESKYKSGPALMVGGTQLAAKYGISPDMLAPENLLIARIGEAIVLSGGDRPDIPAGMVSGRAFVPVGTLYACYEFLERELGIRWYWPGKYGTHIPPCKDLAITRLFVTSRPVYDTRKTFYSLVKGDPDVPHAECEKWYRRNRFGGSVGDPVANHSFNDWIRRFAKTHPEYLALQPDGSRKTDPNPGGGHVCMSHPEVFKQTVADKLAEFKRNKYSNFAKVMPGDSNGLFHCRCEACVKKIRPEMGDRGLFSDQVWGYVNRVAAEVAKSAPGKSIVCCAYGGYLRKPSFPLLPNVAVTLCYSPPPRATLSYKKAWKELLDEWSSTGARLYVWEYWNNTRFGRGVYGAPAVYPRQLKEIYAMDAGRVNGRAIEMCDVDSTGKSINGWADWVYDIQNLYTAGRLMWDPSTDVDAMLDNYYKDFFGPAAAPVKQFYDELEEAWVQRGWEPGNWNFDRVWRHLYPPAFVDKMLGLLQQAVKLAGNQEPYAYRTRKLLAGFKPFDQNSRMFRGGSRKTNSATVTVPRCGGTPGAADWQKALILKDFCDSYNVYTQNSKTEMRLLHDGKNLYVKALCTIPAGVAGVRWAPPSTGAKDGPLWNYESLEFFLANGKESYQFILAPDDKLFDAFNQPDSKKAMLWNSKGVKWSTVRKGNTWEGFLTIPLEEAVFAVPGKNGTFRFNAYRNCRYYMPGEPETWEQSCYLPVYGGFHNIDRFGILKLGK